MFIHHFNRLIRNRILWGAFAFLIALAFVGVPLLGTRMDRGMSAGRLGGQSVPREVFDEAMFFQRGLDPRGQTEEDSQGLNRMTWERVAALHTADAMGIKVGRGEIARTLHRDPAFQVEGRFDPNRYRALLMHHLRMRPETFESFTHQRLVLSKLNELMSAAVWVSPVELQAQVAGMTDVFTLQYAWISNRYAQAEMPLDETALHRHFNEYAETYRIPERIAVRYAAFAVSNHLSEADVSVEDLRDFYHSHSDRFQQAPGTNGVAEPVPFEDVAESIRMELAYDDARFFAASAATRFAEDLIRDRADDAIERLAAAHGIPVHTTALFHARESLPDIDPEASFVEASMDLDADRLDRRVSDAVSGRDWVYVLTAHTHAPSMIPDFETVRDAVEVSALREARADAFSRLSREVHQSTQTVLGQGMDFSAAMADLGISASTNIQFNAFESFSPGGPPHAQAIARAVVHLQPGSLSKPEPGQGGAILAVVHERQPGDPLMADMLRQQLRTQLEQFRVNLVFTDWLAWNLDRLDPEDLFIGVENEPLP